MNGNEVKDKVNMGQMCEALLRYLTNVTKRKLFSSNILLQLI